MLLAVAPLAFAMPIANEIHEAVDHVLAKRVYGIYSGYKNYGGEVSGSSAGYGLSGWGA